MKTADLQGAALDWAVAKSTGLTWDVALTGHYTYKPSTDWTQGGPIIERELIVITPDPQHGWRAMPYMDATKFYGPTPLIAAMRCYVASVLGDEVYVPEEMA